MGYCQCLFHCGNWPSTVFASKQWRLPHSGDGSLAFQGYETADPPEATDLTRGGVLIHASLARVYLWRSEPHLEQAWAKDGS